MAEAEETVVVRVTEETESLYRIPMSRLKNLMLPTSPEEIREQPYIDDEMLGAAIEGLSPVEYSVRERTTTIEEPQ